MFGAGTIMSIDAGYRNLIVNYHNRIVSYCNPWHFAQDDSMHPHDSSSGSGCVAAVEADDDTTRYAIAGLLIDENA